MRNKKKVNYIVTEKFKTSKGDLTEEELKDIFNKKYFRYIMRQEKCISDNSNIHDDTNQKNKVNI